MAERSRETEDRLTELFVLAAALHFEAADRSQASLDSGISHDAIDGEGAAAHVARRIAHMLDDVVGRRLDPSLAHSVGLQDLATGLRDLADHEGSGLTELEREVLRSAADDLDASYD